MEFAIRPEIARLRDSIRLPLEERVYPREKEWFRQTRDGRFAAFADLVPVVAAAARLRAERARLGNEF